MSKGPLRTTRRIFKLAAEMEVASLSPANFVALCAMTGEFEELCARYVGSDPLDPFRKMADEALRRALKTILKAAFAQSKPEADA